MTKFDKALAFLAANPGEQTLNDIRKAGGITLRAQYRLAQRLQVHPQVLRMNGNRFLWVTAANQAEKTAFDTSFNAR